MQIEPSAGSIPSVVCCSGANANDEMLAYPIRWPSRASLVNLVSVQSPIVTLADGLRKSIARLSYRCPS
jgi:hypothetical protein